MTILYLGDSRINHESFHTFPKQMGTLSRCIAKFSKLRLKYTGIYYRRIVIVRLRLSQAMLKNQKIFVLICFGFFYLTTSLQVTDYAIARRIVDLHSRLGEAVERIYSVVRLCSCSAVLCLRSCIECMPCQYCTIIVFLNQCWFLYFFFLRTRCKGT